MRRKTFVPGLATWLLCFIAPVLWAVEVKTLPGRWAEERVNRWAAERPWPVGANYVPRTAINQLEMWQAETFDLETVDQEFGWAANLGFNAMRVFLHDLLQKDAAGLYQRMDAFLAVAERHQIKILFVFFDGVWDPHPYSGKQRSPRPFIHNSGWVQSPGREILRDPSKHEALKIYLQGVLRRFRDDKRILGWDLFNEPDNPNADSYGSIELPNKEEAAHSLLQKAFEWAREVNPSQPLTAGIWLDYGGWKRNSPIYQFMLANSDVITFHNYASIADIQKEVAELKAAYDRPVWCTEYMARGYGSTFDPVLGFLKEAKVGAFHWGLVNGKSQTIYPWETWKQIFTGEPKIWHHDVFRADGSPYSSEEFEYIQKLLVKETD